MTTRMGAIALALAIAGAVAAAQVPIFRSSVHSVIVDVSVLSDNKPVLGLTAADFDIRDRGVPQRISDVSVETLPIDITLVIDVSMSVAGGLLDQLRATVQRVSTTASPADRLRVVSFSHRIGRPLDIGDDVSGIGLATQQLRPEGATSAWDAMVVALASRADPGRRRLVILFSDGRDTSSFLDEETLTSVAARSESVVFVVVGSLTLGSPNMRRLPNGEFFERLSTSTGGRPVVVSFGRPISEGFFTAIDEFRRSYVLRYSPEGVELAGWHDLTVRLKKPGRYDVRARRGYFGR